MDVEATLVSQGLFGASKAAKRPVLETVPVTSGFIAVASQLIDSGRLPALLIKTILADFFKIYPQPKPSALYQTPIERFEQLKQDYQPAVFSQMLAVALRQIVVDKLIEAPEQYASIFSKFTVAQLRQEAESMDLLIELAKVLDINMTIHITHFDEDLPAAISHSAKNSAVSVQLHAHNGVYDKKPYYVGRVPEANLDGYDHTNSRVSRAVDGFKDEVADEYNNNLERLDFMVGRGEIREEKLLEAFSVLTPDACQETFQQLHSAEPDLPIAKSSSQKRLTRGLVQAFSRAVSMKNLSVDDLFTELESEITASRNAPAA